MQTLVEFSCRGQIRIVSAGNRDVMVQFELSIDPKFDKVIILDASATIRDLVDYDETIEIEHCSVAKDYSGVTFKVADVLSSKDSFKKNPQHLTDYLSELRHLLREEIPPEDDVFVFCHREHKDEVTEAVATLREERRGEILVLNWGVHRAVNQYAGCKWVVTLGVMYLPAGLVAALIIGQTGNIRYALTDSAVNGALVSEQAEMIYQAVSRGHCRKTINGKSGEQTVYLFHPNSVRRRIETLLREVMPGMKVEKYYPASLRRGHKNEEEALTIAERILQYVDSDAANVSAISMKKLIKTLDVDSNQRPWRDGCRIALDKIVGWLRKGNSLVRVTLN